MSLTSSSHKPLWQRLTERFSAYTVVGFDTFVIDLGLIWVFINLLLMPQTYAIAAAFLIAVHLNYIILNLWVYRHSTEKVHRTYPYFIILVGIIMFIIPPLVAGFQTWLGLDMLFARMLVGGLLGLIGFSFNTFFNFRFL